VSIFIGMISLAMICAFVLISASFSITEYNKSHTEMNKGKEYEDCYSYLFEVYAPRKEQK